MRLVAKFVGKIAVPGDFSGEICYVPEEIKKGQVLALIQATPFHVGAISKAGGLLIEFPGVVQHAITLAREFGVPSIVGLSNITKIRANYVIVKKIDDVSADVRLYDQ